MAEGMQPVAAEWCGAGDPLARAHALGPLIAAMGEDIERGQRLPEPLVAALHEARLFRLLLPRWLGGEELSPHLFVQVVEALAAADASVAWCVSQGCVTSMSAAWLPQEAARQIFGPANGVLAWGPPHKAARAMPVEGGYRVTGSWDFASGSWNATWLGCHSMVQLPDGNLWLDAKGAPEFLALLYPRDKAEILPNWQVMGLRGTGSDSYRVEDLFVPAAFTFRRDNAEDRKDPALLYRFTTGALYSSGFAGVALGIARAMLDALVEMAHARTPRGMKNPLRQNAVVQMQVSQAEAMLQSSRAWLLQSLREAEAAIAREGVMRLEQRMRLRLASTYTINQAVAAADMCFKAAGSGAIFESTAFARRFRDIHAVGQHQQGRLFHFETVGQYLLGIEADWPFV